MERIILLAIVLFAILPATAFSQRAGKLEVVESQFDGTVYVAVEPGWTRNLRRNPLGGILGGDLKVGAVIHSELGTLLVVRVDEILRILEVELLVGDSPPVKLERLGKTDIELEAENRFDITHSEASFRIDYALLHDMVSGDMRAWVRAHTSEGYIEADFGETCKSRWRDRACVAVRRAVEKAKDLGLVK